MRSKCVPLPPHQGPRRSNDCVAKSDSNRIGSNPSIHRGTIVTTFECAYHITLFFIVTTSTLYEPRRHALWRPIVASRHTRLSACNFYRFRSTELVNDWLISRHGRFD